MSEEKANQIIRCVKECWWRVTVMLSIPAITAIALFSTWPWKESPWVAMSAISTLCASVIALWLGLDQIRRSERRKEREGRVIAALTCPLIQKAAKILKQCINVLEPSQEKDFTDLTKAQISSLWSLERITVQHILAVSELHPYPSGVLGQNINFVIGVLEHLGLPKEKNATFCYRSFVWELQEGDVAKDLCFVTNSLSELAEITRKSSYQKANET